MYIRKFTGNLDKENQKLLDSFKVYIEVKNYRGAMSTYTQPILEFLLWTQKRGINNVLEIKNYDLVSFYDYLSTRPNLRRGGTLSDSSINRRLFALRIFFSHLLEQKMVNRSLIIPNRSDKTKENRKILTVEEIKELFDVCENQFERALLSVAYGCGLRRTEIQKLNTIDIIFSKGYLTVRMGKGGKKREVPMSDAVINDLRAYLLGERNERIAKRPNKVKAFFVTKQSDRASGWYLNDSVQQLCVRTGNQEIIDKHISLHCLRHSIATHLADNGASMDFVREFLGHALIDTSQIYAMKRKKNRIFRV